MYRITQNVDDIKPYGGIHRELMVRQIIGGAFTDVANFVRIDCAFVATVLIIVAIFNFDETKIIVAIASDDVKLGETATMEVTIDNAISMFFQIPASLSFFFCSDLAG